MMTNLIFYGVGVRGLCVWVGGGGGQNIITIIYWPVHDFDQAIIIIY